MTETGMAGLEVETRPEIAAPEPSEPARYLVLGDFGTHALGVRPVDPETLDGVLDIVGVEIAGLPIHQLEDFHPDRLYQRLDLFGDLRGINPESAAAPPVELREHERYSQYVDPKYAEEMSAPSDPAGPFENFVRRIAR